MSGERSHPVLPCPDLLEALTFYEALGFTVTFRQLRPYPCAVVELDDLAIHLSGIDGFDPATSVASVIITLPDLQARYDAFAAGLRAQYGKLPVTGVPRLLRLRRKQGTATGFTLVDPGGTWLRCYQTGASEEDDAAEDDRGGVLDHVVAVAARQGDARGDDSLALAVLDRGLARHPDAPAPERVRALLYRSELLVRLGRGAEARETFDLAGTLVDDREAAALAPDLAHAREVLASAG